MNASYENLDRKAILRRYGLEPGGRAQKYWTSNVQRRIKKYLPFRKNGSVVNAVDQGASEDNREIVVALHYARYLFYGKAMAGKPKQPTGRPLVYTKDHNPQAGPDWDKRLVQHEIHEMEREMKDYLEEHKK